MTAMTLADLDRLAAPLHARVVTKEAMEMMTRLAYEKGLAEARQQDGSALRDALERIAHTIPTESKGDHYCPWCGTNVDRHGTNCPTFIARAALAALPPNAPPALDARKVREAVSLSLDNALGPPADGMSKAVRRAIEDEVVARLQEQDR